MKVAWGSPETEGSTTVGANPYDLEVDWAGPTSTIGTVHALQWTTVGNGPPNSYVAYGKTAGITIAGGGTTSHGTDVALLPVVSTGHVSGTVTLPPSSALVVRLLEMAFEDNAAMMLFQDGAPSTAFDWLVPAGTDGSFQVGFTAYDADAGTDSIVALRGLAPGSTGLTVDIPAAPELLSPGEDSGLVGPDTTFSWSATPGIHLNLIEPQNPGSPAYFIFTTRLDADPGPQRARFSSGR